MNDAVDIFKQDLRGKIAFLSLSGSKYEICIMRADGSSRTSLITFPSYETICFVDYSPNGEQILFTAHRDGNYEIYAMNSDGSDQKRLTYTGSTTYGGVWSPDYRHIAFTSCLSRTEEIYVMNADGSGRKQLTDTAYFEQGFPHAYNRNPAWSPDSQQLAFTSARSENLEIHVMNADGSDTKQITDFEGSKDFPKWSPDGNQIAFMGQKGLSIVDLSGGSLHQLILDGFLAFGTFAWSPDSKYIVYSSHVDVDMQNKNIGHGEIFVMRIADGQSVRLTMTNANNHYPCWIA